MRLTYDPDSNEPDQKLLVEYIKALPNEERENYNSDVVVNMVRVSPSEVTEHLDVTSLSVEWKASAPHLRIVHTEKLPTPFLVPRLPTL
jgi:hypothetical protein